MVRNAWPTSAVDIQLHDTDSFLQKRVDDYLQ
jgi:hypothetical protein